MERCLLDFVPGRGASIPLYARFVVLGSEQTNTVQTMLAMLKAHPLKAFSARK